MVLLMANTMTPRPRTMKTMGVDMTVPLMATGPVLGKLSLSGVVFCFWSILWCGNGVRDEIAEIGL